MTEQVEVAKKTVLAIHPDAGWSEGSGCIFSPSLNATYKNISGSEWWQEEGPAWIAAASLLPASAVEEKAAPSGEEIEHKYGWHYGYITCSCGWAWDSRNALTGSLATQHGLRMFEKHKANPQPDSSSISTEQPNPLVGDEDIAFIMRLCNGGRVEKVIIELQQWREWGAAWNAAKGQR